MLIQLGLIAIHLPVGGDNGFLTYAAHAMLCLGHLTHSALLVAPILVLTDCAATRPRRDHDRHR